MINEDRIVPVQKTDLITMYGTIMKLAGTSVAAAEAVAPGCIRSYKWKWQFAC